MTDITPTSEEHSDATELLASQTKYYEGLINANEQVIKEQREKFRSLLYVSIFLLTINIIF